MARLEVVLETRDPGLKRGRGESGPLAQLLLCTANCRYAGIRRAPRCGQPDESWGGLVWQGVGGFFLFFVLCFFLVVVCEDGGGEGGEGLLHYHTRVARRGSEGGTARRGVG